MVPVRTGLFAVHPAVDDAVDERGVRQRIAAAPQPLGHLHVDEFAGGLAGVMQTEADFRLAAVRDDRRLVVGHQLPPAGQTSSDLQRIHGGRALGGRELQQAELRLVGIFGDELGIERDEARFPNMDAELVELILLDDQRDGHIVSACSATRPGDRAALSYGPTGRPDRTVAGNRWSEIWHARASAASDRREG